MSTDLCTFAVKVDVTISCTFIAYVAFKSDGMEHDWQSSEHESRAAAVNEAADFLRRRFLSHQMAFEVITFGVPQL